MSHAQYTALSGAIAQERALEAIADNLANVNTTGFKGTKITFRSILVDDAGQPAISQAELDVQNRMLLQKKVDRGELPSSVLLPDATGHVASEAYLAQKAQATSDSRPAHVQVRVSGSYVDMEQGALKTTNNPLDFALTGPGFFSVQTPHGQRLTRQGAFRFDEQGRLKNYAGHLVEGQNGPIQIDPRYEVRADAQGAIYSNGQYVDTLKRVNVTTSKDLQREGESLFSVSLQGQVENSNTPLQVGALEQSNINPVSTMTQLIGVQRAYESYHRVMETIHNLEQKTSSQLG